MEGITLSQKYKITRLINGGSFCKLYEAIHIYKKQIVAIKCESSEIGKKVLDNEINMYIYLKKYKINIPNIKDIGIYENYKYIVMELLQITLKEYFIKYEINMEMLINNMFDVIQPFHERMLVHRDIKPENFIFDNKWNIYIIDLGLSTFVSQRKMNTFIGNKLYASYNCHLSEYVYRQNDDLISIVYMLLHLYTGALPWDKTPFDHTYPIKSNPKPRSLFNLHYILENKFNSESHSEYYNLKKNTNYVEFYKKIDKYDQNVTYLLEIYDRVK
jgi:serine/threonine protein kinase